MLWMSGMKSMVRIGRILGGRDMENEYMIVDIKGNYYKIGSKDELVFARSREEATILSFAEANRRIGGGKKAFFYSAIPVQDYEEESLSDSVSDDIETINNDFIFDWEGWLDSYLEMADKIERHQDYMRECHSVVDSKICDVLHYLEMYELDDTKRIELAKKLEELRMERRTIKDQLFIVDVYLRDIVSDEKIKNVKSVLNSVHQLDTRKYKPRFLDELFKSGRKKSFKAVTTWGKTEMTKEQNGEDGIIRQTEVYKSIEKDGGEFMDRERIATVFDRTDINLKSYITEQVQFYRDINQHITNLELDIREIDESIEDLLKEAEESNYNAVQGYKVFRELKELRITKAKKVTELNDYMELHKVINCYKLADALEDSCEKMTDTNVTENVVGVSA